MKIFCIASEVEPFAKTGGLADVAAALPKALAARGHDVRLVMPLYREVNRRALGVTPTALRVSVVMGSQALQGRVWEAEFPKSRVRTYFIEQAPFFDRDGLYQEQGKDHPDNLARFSFFSQAALRLLPLLDWRPDIVHCHDWQTALASAHLAWGALGREPALASVGTVFTIHNLAYQGLFPKDQWELTGLPSDAFALDRLEFHGKVSCLKGGLVSADALTTVSPTYAQEIQTREFGCGLDGVLKNRQSDLMGILNGIDVEVWHPQIDSHLSATYTAGRLAGKTQCKAALQQSQRLPQRSDLLIGMIQRLAEQKGIDIFAEALERLMKLPIQIVLVGTGDPKYHQLLAKYVAQFPEQLACNFTFDHALAHQIEAGADAFLMPSRFEPCGLNQMYSMRYGTVPIVRRVGGLADTVNETTGFMFEEYSASALVEAVTRAVNMFRDREAWKRLMRAGMQQDFSWSRSALEYERVYERVLAKRRAG